MKKGTGSFSLAFAVVSLGACGSQELDGGTVEAEPNELHIAQVEVEQTLIDGNHLLVVRGLDSTGREVGVAKVRSGRIDYNTGIETRTIDEGKELTITVGDQIFFRQYPDLLTALERDPREPDVAQFVRIGAVADALDQEPGVRFVRRATEAGYSYVGFICSIAGNWGYDARYFFPSNKGNVTSCCVDGDWQGSYFSYAEAVHKPLANLNNVGHRDFLSTPCRQSDGIKACNGGATSCTWGPCNARVLTTVSGNASSNVFFMNSLGAHCGWDSNGAAAGGNCRAGECYSNQSVVTDSLQALCPYQSCVNGVPSTNPPTAGDEFP